jgi:type II secretory pathway component PulJ
MNRLLRKTKAISGNQFGFTLAELIISVGTLAIVGILTIQFFLTAKDINRRASELDHSVYLANTIIESVKADLWDRYPLDKFYRMPNNTDEKSVEGKLFFDKEWQIVKETHPMVLFEVTMWMNGQENSIQDRSLYDITLEIRRIKPYFRGKDIQPVIYSTDTTIYIKTLKESELP